MTPQLAGHSHAVPPALCAEMHAARGLDDVPPLRQPLYAGCAAAELHGDAAERQPLALPLQLHIEAA